MAKRAAKQEEIKKASLTGQIDSKSKKPFSSSKGFLTMKGEDSEKLMR